jgi:ADP-ribose pyrophosphatase
MDVPKAMRDISAIEVVDDRTAGTQPDEGFLRVKRLVVRNHYTDGSQSDAYACDVVSRQNIDAVAVVLYERASDGSVRVALKAGVRPPIYFRKDKALTHPDTEQYLLLPEIVAGMLEPEDAGEGGIDHRAALECMEEAGFAVADEAIQPLGGPLFASPGITDEKVHYRCAAVVLAEACEPTGDGSVMEEAGGVVILELEDAIRRCRDGRIPDAKTELALVRLRDQLRAESD